MPPQCASVFTRASRTHVVKPPLTASKCTGGMSKASTMLKCASMLISDGSGACESSAACACQPLRVSNDSFHRATCSLMTALDAVLAP